MGPYAPFLVSNYFGVKRVPPHTDQSVPMPQKLPDASAVKNPPAMQKMWIPSLGQEDSLQREMATHSSILAWEIPWTEEPSGLQSTGSRKSWTRLRTKHSIAHQKQKPTRSPQQKLTQFSFFCENSSALWRQKCVFSLHFRIVLGLAFPDI